MLNDILIKMWRESKEPAGEERCWWVMEQDERKPNLLRRAPPEKLWNLNREFSWDTTQPDPKKILNLTEQKQKGDLLSTPGRNRGKIRYIIFPFSPVENWKNWMNTFVYTGHFLWLSEIQWVRFRKMCIGGKGLRKGFFKLRSRKNRKSPKSIMEKGEVR